MAEVIQGPVPRVRASVVTCLPHELFPDRADIHSVVKSIRRGIPIYVGGVAGKIGGVVPGDVIRLLVYSTNNVGSEKYSLGLVIEKGYTEDDGIDFCIEFNGGTSPKAAGILDRG